MLLQWALFGEYSDTVTLQNCAVQEGILYIIRGFKLRRYGYACRSEPAYTASALIRGSRIVYK